VAIGALLADAHVRGVDELHVGVVSFGNGAHRAAWLHWRDAV